MKVFITRPREDAEPLAAAFAEAGFEPVVVPLMTIETVEGPAPDLTNVQALAFTSANGVRAYAARGGAMDLPAFAVGAATGEALRAAGFASVTEAEGDVASLGRLIAARCDPQKGAVLHAAGAAVAGDLVGALKGKGLVARRETLYRAEPVRALPDALPRFLETAGPDTIGALMVLYSPRTACIALNLMSGAKLDARSLGAVCLSPTVARIVQDSQDHGWLTWGAVAVADTPHSAAIIAAARSLAGPAPQRFGKNTGP